MQRLWQFLIRVFNALSPARRIVFIAATFFVVCLLTLVTARRPRHGLAPMQAGKVESAESYLTDPRGQPDSPNALEEEAMRTRQIGAATELKTSSLAPSYDSLRSEPHI